MTESLRTLIDAFARWAGYTDWHVEPDGDLTMFDGKEPFGLTEYKEGSAIRVLWKGLQTAIAADKDGEPSSKARCTCLPAGPGHDHSDDCPKSKG